MGMNVLSTMRSLVSMRTLGFASAYVWIFAVYLCSPAVPSWDGGGRFSSLFYIVSFGVAVLCLLLIGFCDKIRKHLIVGGRHGFNAFVALGTLFAAFGTAWLAVEQSQPMASWLATAVIGVVTGFGQAVLFLAWGRVLSACQKENVIAKICASFLMASIGVCVLAMVPPPYGTLALAVFPLFSAYTLIRGHCSFETDSGGLDESECGPSAVAEGKRLLLRVCAGALLMGLLMGVLRCLAGGEVSFGEIYAVSKLVASVICCLAVAFASRSVIEFSAVYRAIVLFMGLGIVSYPFLESSVAFVVVSRIGVSCFEAFLWVLIVGFVKCFGLDSAKSTALCWASLTGGLCVGAIAGNAFVKQGLLTIGSLTVALVLLFALFLMFLFVLSDRDIISLEGWGVFSRNGSASTEMKRFAPVKMEDARETVSHVINRRSTEVAKQFGLSSREREITALLAMGKSRSQIGKDLYLSLGTVNTHVSHIYAKLGIHSKDELIGLFAAEEAEN